MAEESAGFPSIIVPNPFDLSAQDSSDLDKIREEIMDKVSRWERGFNRFFLEREEMVQSWRIRPRDFASKKPRGISNSKSGEMHRAVETLSTFWFRMMTAADKYIEVLPMGTDENGREYSPEDLYAVESLLIKQNRALRFKQNLMRGLRSGALFGTMIFEEPWISRPNQYSLNTVEGTGFEFRSLLTVGFDPTVFDIELSDYIFTFDYPTIYKLKQMSRSNDAVFDRSLLLKFLESEKESDRQTAGAKLSNVLNLIKQRKMRAGYLESSSGTYELLNYHGRLDTENRAIQAYYESLGIDDPIDSFDFTVGILEGSDVIRLHRTQYGSWRTRFKIAHTKQFELEPVGYGVGTLGAKLQREIDVTESRMNDIILFALYSMWKVGRAAGLKADQLSIKPWNLIELDDISQLEKIAPNIEAVAQALNLQALKKEDLRSSSGATSNLQAIVTKSSATEASLVQNEATRGAGVTAELISEIVMREHFEQMHVNNLDFLDNDVLVSIAGTGITRRMNKDVLPVNIGVEMKITTDRTFRPERSNSLLNALQLATSIRNIMPNEMNVVEPLIEEYYRTIDLNPRLLRKPRSVADKMIDQAARTNRLQNNPALQNELFGQTASSGIEDGQSLNSISNLRQG